jgi:Domain of unknown function (DUF4157)/LysM domain
VLIASQARRWAIEGRDSHPEAEASTTTGRPTDGRDSRMVTEPEVPSNLHGLLRLRQDGSVAGAGTRAEQARLLRALQRTAGNAAVNRLLRQVVPPDADTASQDDSPASAPTGATRPLLVADDAQTADGQMRQSDFLNALEPVLRSVALARLGEQANPCPWITHWIGYYRERHPAEAEQAMVRYAPETANARTAADCIDLIGKRADAGIVTWQESGQMPTAGGSSEGEAGLQRAVLQRAPTGTADPAQGEVAGKLGRGRPLDPGVSARFGSALGADLGGVLVHDDHASGAVVGSLGAAAIAVGHHVAFAPGRYEPGTPLGDSLLAHELAHVIQQHDGGAQPTVVEDGGRLEADADAAAVSAIDRLYGGPAGPRGLRPVLRSGLRVQACRSGTAPPAPAPPAKQAPAFKTAGAGPDLMTGTHAVTAAQQADVEAILQPGSTVVAPPVGAPAAPPVVMGPPPMTGAGPGGAFEKEMLKFLKDYTHAGATAFKARKAAAPATFTFAEAEGIAREAQAQVEKYFDKWITAASRRPADKYHKGTYDLATKLADESTRSTTDPTKVTRHGWASYWMGHGQGKTITDKYHCSYSDRDRAEFERVRDLFVNDPANQPDIDDTIHSWPGENSDKVYIQPWGTADPKKKREARWDLFTVLLHEMLHSLQHPNYVAAFVAIGGTGEELLKEGMLDAMRRDLWDPGGGDLGTWLTPPAAAGVRLKVEGANYPVDPSVIVYHDDYENLPEARQVVAKVGLDNCKAAFFLGKVDLLGLSADPAKTVTGTPLAHIASWEATDPTNADIYVAQTGESPATIALKCGVDASEVKREDGSALAAGYTPAAGDRLKVKGIRYVHAVDGDTLDTLAAQNGVTAESIAAANDYPAGTPGGTGVAAGTRVLIPHRRS